MRIAIVENSRNTHYGQVGVALAEAGNLTDVYRPYLGGPLPGTDDRHAGIVVFGGDQSAMADDQHPYLADLARLMRGWGEAGRAVLGICLGSQILARGYGGRNQLGGATEYGWTEVRLTDQGRDDPVLGMVPPAFRSFQWHDDTFSLPPGALHLAVGQRVAHQAFRMAPRVYGMQFHFEANRSVVTRWTDETPGNPPRTDRGDPSRLAGGLAFSCRTARTRGRRRRSGIGAGLGAADLGRSHPDVLAVLAVSAGGGMG